MNSWVISSSLALGVLPTVHSFWQQKVGGAPYGTSFAFPPPSNATYDYVIVGGGTAGLTVASRLAENKSLSIAVVEAGTFYELANGNYSQVPAYSTQFAGGDVDAFDNLWIDWGLVTTPQPQLDGRQIRYAQGKCLGGSSGRNQMIYQRGSAGSYDLWAKEVGDASYRWDNILNFFKKSTTFTPANKRFRAANASTSYDANAYAQVAEVKAFNASSSAPLHVSYPNYALPFSSWGIRALQALGLKSIPGFSSGDIHGVSYNPFTIDPTDETRSSSETAFLQPAIARDLPITVYPMSQVQRIIFDDDKRATGVQVEPALGASNFTLFARHEVIVSAGAMHSPQLLMVSGVGPAETLKQHCIDVVADRPGVGQNMHDTCNINGITHEIYAPSFALLDTAEYAAKAVEQYIRNGSGMLTTTGGDVLAFEKLPQKYRSQLSKSTLQRLSRWPADWPELELVLVSTGRTLSPEKTASANYATVGTLMVATLSRGNLTISSASMKDRPVISTNWLLDPADQEVAVQSWRRAREVWSLIPDSIKGPEVLPGANVTTDAEILQAIRENVGSIHHASSTCMMGREDERMAVVDSRGRVIGVKNLRVVDSSSFRFTPPGHTQAATYAHAEKLVEDILEDLRSLGEIYALG